jgi:hypothetical protein
MPTSTPVTVTQTSPKGKMSAQDWLWTIGAAVVLPVLPIVNATLAAGSLTFPWKSIGVAAVAGFVGMLTKKITGASQTIITGAEPGSTINVTAPPVGNTTTTTATK